VNFFIGPLNPSQAATLQLYWRLLTQPFTWALMILLGGWGVAFALGAWRRNLAGNLGNPSGALNTGG
jgi:hypothetical protein